MKSWKWALIWGIVTWVVPFAVAIPFYTPNGELLIEEHYFKTLMVVVGAATGAIAIVMYLRNARQGFLLEAVKVGMLWLAMNWVIDLLVLVPMMGTGVVTYFGEIGFRYVSLLFMCVAAGTVADRALAECCAKKKGRQ